MHLVSPEPQRIQVEDRWFDFHPGESIHTENSYKYTVAGFAELAGRGGFRQEAVWCDAEVLFSVQLLAAGSIR